MGAAGGRLGILPPIVRELMAPTGQQANGSRAVVAVLGLAWFRQSWTMTEELRPRQVLDDPCLPNSSLAIHN